MTPKTIYTITILIHSEGEAGHNPGFQFDDKKQAYAFMETCFDNFYNVEVNKQQLEIE
jgi:hypothetical protein